MNDVENDRSLSNSGRSTPTRGHRDFASKSSPLTESSSARALRAIEAQDAARRAPGGLARQEVRDAAVHGARRRHGADDDTDGRVSEKATDRRLFPSILDSSSTTRTRRASRRATANERLTMYFSFFSRARRMNRRRSRDCYRNKSARTF